MANLGFHIDVCLRRRNEESIKFRVTKKAEDNYPQTILLEQHTHLKKHKINTKYEGGKQLKHQKSSAKANSSSVPVNFIPLDCYFDKSSHI